MGPGTYKGTPFLVTSITNTKGKLSNALHSRYGLGKVILKPDRGVYGRIFFQIADHTKPASVRIRLFGYGPGTKVTVFTIEHGNKPSSSEVAPPPTRLEARRRGFSRSLCLASLRDRGRCLDPTERTAS